MIGCVILEVLKLHGSIGSVPSETSSSFVTPSPSQSIPPSTVKGLQSSSIPFPQMSTAPGLIFGFVSSQSPPQLVYPSLSLSNPSSTNPSPSLSKPSHVSISTQSAIPSLSVSANPSST